MNNIGKKRPINKSTSLTGKRSQKEINGRRSVWFRELLTTGMYSQRITGGIRSALWTLLNTFFTYSKKLTDIDKWLAEWIYSFTAHCQDFGQRWFWYRMVEFAFLVTIFTHSYDQSKTYQFAIEIWCNAPSCSSVFTKPDWNIYILQHCGGNQENDFLGHFIIIFLWHHFANLREIKKVSSIRIKAVSRSADWRQYLQTTDSRTICCSCY